MLEYTGAGDGARLTMLVLHDDDKPEYAYGPAQGLPDTKVPVEGAVTRRPAKSPHGPRMLWDHRRRRAGERR